jgi:acetyl-CoA acetyltransferase
MEFRTPIGALGGSLSPVRADDLAAMVIKELMKRNSTVPTESVDDIIMGLREPGWR